MAQRRGHSNAARQLGRRRGRRAAASLALIAGGLSGGIVAPTVSPVGAAPQDVNLICAGTPDDSAGLFPDTTTGGFDSQFLVSFLIGQIGLPGPDEPQTYPGPQLGFAATAQLDHDLPASMLTTDAPATVHVDGSVQLSSGFLTALGHLGVAAPFGLAATNHVGVGGAGVTGSQASGSPAAVTQDPGAAPVSIPVDVTVTATPTPDGGPVQLDYDVAVKLALNQQSSWPSPLDLATLSMTCETAGEPQEYSFPDGFDPDLEGADPLVAAPQPLADGFVARPGGVIARTDRLLTTEPMAHLDVVANDEALGAGRSIDPTSIEVSSTEELVEVEVDGGHLMFTAEPIPFSESPYNGFEGLGAIDQLRFPTLAGLPFSPFVRARATYRICDDGDPASCADGLAEVIMPLAVGDPCDDPNLQSDCGPWEPEPETTCADDMSACEVPGCTWSDDDGRYVCVYPGELHHDPPGPGSGSDDPPSSAGEPPDSGPGGSIPNGGAPNGRGPGEASPRAPGTPLTPAFTG